MDSLRFYLRARRTDLGLTQHALVSRVQARFPGIVGFTKTALGAWENGIVGRSPSDVQLIAWAGALDCQILIHPVGSAPVAITYDAAACRGAA